ncbi:MAG: hypothetical protein KDD70_07920 [Bdellovibrionales bacterium]|nr:hypothetical protein [Bdellovibrionales bacterium]
MLKYIVNSENRHILPAIGCLFGVSAFRVTHVFLNPPSSSTASDGLRHWINAQDTLGESPTSNWDPLLYQLYLATTQKLSGGIPELVTWFAALLSLSMIFAWWYALSRILPKATALYCSAIFGLVPEWVGLYSFHLNETLFLTLLGYAVGLTFDCIHKMTVRCFVVSTVTWVLVSLTRGIGVPLMVVSLLNMLSLLNARQRILGVATALAIVLPFSLPLAIKSYTSFRLIHPFGLNRGNEIMARTGALTQRLQLSRDGASWSYSFDSARGTDRPLAPISDYRTIRHGEVQMTIDLSNGDYKEEVNLPFADSQQALTLIGDDIIFTLFGVPWPHVSNGSSYAKLGWYTRWFWGILFLLLPLILWLRKPLLREERLLVWLIFSWITIQFGGLFIPGQSRYRLPFEALSLLLLCSVAFRERILTKTVGKTDLGRVPDTQYSLDRS